MKNVFITGVLGGLGKALARQYLEDGYAVFGCDVHEEDTSDLSKTYPGFYYTAADVRSENRIQAAVKNCQDAGMEAVDLLINCAGILPPNSEQLLEQFEIEGALDVFNVNALGPLRVVKELLPLIKKGDGRTILNISSEAGSITSHADYVNRYDYCMSKAALNIQSVILQRYLQTEEIKVLVVHPGWMRTDMGGAQAPLMPEESAADIRELVRHTEKNYHNIALMDYNGIIRPW